MTKIVTEIVVIMEDTETHNQELHSFSGEEIVKMQGMWCLYTPGGSPHIVETNEKFLERFLGDPTLNYATRLVQAPPLKHMLLDIIEGRAPVFREWRLK